MLTTKRLFYMLIFLHGCTATLQAQKVTTRLHFDLSIGDDESLPREYLFAFPEFISTDSRGHIYITDARSSSIRVFSSEGEFVKSIGSRGQGPGEFLDVTSMVVDSRDDLIVVDHFNMRITRFSDMGDNVETYPIPVNGRAQPWHIRTLGPERFVLYYQVYNKESPQGQGKLLHVFNHDFQAALESLAEKSDIWDLTVAYDKARAGGPYSANMTTVGDSLIIIVPVEYNGSVYFYKKHNDQWTLDTYKGVTLDFPAYKLLDSKDYPDRDSWPQPIRALGWFRESFLVLLHNMSRGIFVLNDGTVVHFSMLRNKKGKYIYGVEFFDISGRFLGYAAVKNYKPFAGDELPGLNVLWKDDRDRFYLVDRSDFPTVWRMELEYAIKGK